MWVAGVEPTLNPSDNMANPKRKQSKRRSRLRRGQNQFRAPKLVKDAESGALRRPHRVDPVTGKYRGRQVLDTGA